MYILNILLREAIALIVAFFYGMFIRWIMMSKKFDKLTPGWHVVVTIIISIVGLATLLGLINWG